MRLHILSNSPHVNSGYARVVTSLALELKKLGYDIAITGMQTSYRMEEYRGIPVYPMMSDYFDAGSVSLQINRLILNMKAHKSEALLCLFQGDSMYNPFTQVHPKTVWYLPIEGRIIYRSHPLFRDARRVRKVVAMTHSAGEQLRKQGIENTVIYHGYDPNVFRKDYIVDLNEPVIVYFPAKHEEITIPACMLPDLKEKMGVECLIGFVGQNFGIRKRIERLIEAFSIFSKDKKDVHLHLHCNPVHSRGVNLLEILDYYNLNTKVTFSYGNIISSGWSEQALNILYNQFDIFASASSGEGFGLPHLESMACGISQVAPDVEPFREFFGHDDNKRGLLARATGQFTPAGEIRGLVDPQSMAEKMESLFAYPELRKKLGANAEKWAAQFTWDKIASQFDKAFKEIL